MRESLDPGDGNEGKLGDDLAVEDVVEHGQERGEGESDGEHGLHLDHHEVAVRVLQSLLVSLHLALLGPAKRGSLISDCEDQDSLT